MKPVTLLVDTRVTRPAMPALVRMMVFPAMNTVCKGGIAGEVSVIQCQMSVTMSRAGMMLLRDLMLLEQMPRTGDHSPHKAPLPPIMSSDSVARRTVASVTSAHHGITIRSLMVHFSAASVTSPRRTSSRADQPQDLLQGRARG